MDNVEPSRAHTSRIDGPGTTVIGVIGSGLMGVGIATQSALHGYRTIVYDVDETRLASVAPKAEAILDELVDAGRIDLAAKQVALARIERRAQLDAMSEAGFVIEAIPEVLELKHRLYAALAEVLGETAILASNTSGFPPDRLASALHAPERFVIAHFWNPPHLIPLVEVVPGSVTSSDVTARTVALMEAIGMEPVVLEKAIPGFVGNRLQFALLREALNIVRSGAASPEVVDRVMKASLGRRWSIVGPLESADLGGLDTILNVGTHLMPELANDNDVLDLLREQVDAGRVGVRSGAGFYEWDEARLARVRALRKRLIGGG